MTDMHESRSVVREGVHLYFYANSHLCMERCSVIVTKCTSLPDPHTSLVPSLSGGFVTRLTVPHVRQ